MWYFHLEPPTRVSVDFTEIIIYTSMNSNEKHIQIYIIVIIIISVYTKADESVILAGGVSVGIILFVFFFITIFQPRPIERIEWP